MTSLRVVGVSAAAAASVFLNACGSGDETVVEPVRTEPVGCDEGRAATAYKATATGVEAVSELPGTAENTVPCLALTGYGANEPRIGLASDGTVYFGPAQTSDGNGIARSKDQGATWTVEKPVLPGGGGHTRLQPFLYLDPDTDRLFHATSKLVLDGLANFVDEPGIHLTISADGGESWEYHSMAPECRDWQKIFAGPPVTSVTEGYDNVVYFSAPSPIAGNWGGIYPPPDFQHVYKSLNGGDTWEEVSQLPIDPAKIEGCVPNDDFVMFSQGVVDHEGTVYLGYRMCQQLAIVVSYDEGETWETRVIPGAALAPYDTSSILGILAIIGGENAITGQPIAVDEEGNLYAVWADSDNVLHYATSEDQGVTWSTPVEVMAPGVVDARMVAITAKEKGQVAIAYFGSDDKIAYHGYIAESKNGLDAEPTFWTAPTNDPADPLYKDGWQSGYDLTYFDNGGDEVTLIQVAYGPEGDLFASFVKDMCPGGDLNACEWDYWGLARSRFQGAMGRLTSAPSAAPEE